MLKRILSSNHFLMVTCLLITGLGIGWLVGLSVSPVVSVVITSVTGAAAAIVAALSGLEEKPETPEGTNKGQPIGARWNINPLPLTVLVVGIFVGSLFGVRAQSTQSSIHVEGAGSARVVGLATFTEVPDQQSSKPSILVAGAGSVRTMGLVAPPGQ